MIGGWNWKDEDNNSSANSTVYKTTELQSVGGENGETKKSESVVSSLWKERLPPTPRRPSIEKRGVKGRRRRRTAAVLARAPQQGEGGRDRIK